MKSSKIEKMYDFDSSLEDAKTLSPLTYYQPFQSSFDPAFTAVTTAAMTNKHRPRQNIAGTPFGKWRRAPAEEAERFEFGGREAGGSTTPFPVPGRSAAEAEPARLPTSPAVATWAPVPVGFGPRSAVRPSSRRSEPDPPLPAAEPAASGVGAFDESAFALAFGFGESRTRSHPVALSTPTPEGKAPSQNSYKTGHNRPMMCNFCKNNKEVPDIYLNHFLYDPETKVLTCPVLRKHVCEICGGTGDRAHTLQYCPVNRERGLQAKVPVLLKTRTITNSTGKIRRN